MVNYCFVPLCSTSGTNGLHRYPLKPERRMKWMTKTKTSHFLPNEDARICRKHFEEKDLVIGIDGKKRLVPHAVPSLFLPGPLTLNWEHNYASITTILKKRRIKRMKNLNENDVLNNNVGNEIEIGGADHKENQIVLGQYVSIGYIKSLEEKILKLTKFFYRIAWAVIVIAALITSIILLWISWQWNAETPTTTVIESTHYATSNVPFPAVTVCNMNKISSAAASKLADRMIKPSNLTAPELSRMFRMLLHFEGISKPDPDGYERLHSILQTNNMTVTSVLKELTPNKCVDMLQRCKWKGTQVRCDTLFQQIYTSDGLCCSFNYLGRAKSNFPPKMDYNNPKYPRRVTACGYLNGISFLAKPFVDDYHSTFLSSFGFRVYIHSSYDFPDDNAETKSVASRLEAFISLSPESTYSTPAVYELPLRERDCYFPKEGKTNTMKYYSYVNCMAECRSKLIYELCGCIPYQFPNNGSFPTCGINKIECVTRHKTFYSGALPGVNSTSYRLEDSPCKCLPDCELYQYPSEISSGTLNREYSFNSLSFFKDIEIYDQSLIHVFFIDLVSTHYRKDVYQNWLGVLVSDIWDVSPADYRILCG